MPDSLSGSTAVNSVHRLTPPMFNDLGILDETRDDFRSPSPFFIPPPGSPGSEPSELALVNSRAHYEEVDFSSSPGSVSGSETTDLARRFQPGSPNELCNRFGDLSFQAVVSSTPPEIENGSNGVSILDIPLPLPQIRGDPNPLDISTLVGIDHSVESDHDTPRPPIPPPSLVSPGDRSPQIPWEEIQTRMKDAYDNRLDNGLLDCLLVQNTDDFIFFDIKFTHIGDYLEIRHSRTPVQFCFMDFNGDLIYQANLAMFDPRNGREIVTMHQWVCLISDYQNTGAMSRRWYNEARVQDAIYTMRGYFWSKDIPRKTIWQIKTDLAALRLRHKILFSHDGSLITYDLLRGLLPDGVLPPRLLTMSSHKIIKLILPTMPRDLYGFYYHIVDLNTFADPSNPVLHKHIATEDAMYTRQIFEFFIKAWRAFQTNGGRPLAEHPNRLVDVWDGFPPDSPFFGPVGLSDDDEDRGMSLSEVEAWDSDRKREEEEEEELAGMGDDDGGVKVDVQVDAGSDEHLDTTARAINSNFIAKGSNSNGAVIVIDGCESDQADAEGYHTPPEIRGSDISSSASH
ncbi:hypothetical protein H072_11116 [Dactylellina haptotyla CBS 200.50]|uniref:Uncharacterized protein n=1 Tax=Dactylellina haptotyla (strain CBS 200.50) TaxID=1284197 RepID=S8B8X6_DACHA|nr:hypothetical protein H072_11116 [Dactylellina haptotyla CBS 200.50]